MLKLTNRQKNKQTGQKQYAPDHSIRGHKKIKNTEIPCVLPFLAEKDKHYIYAKY